MPDVSVERRSAPRHAMVLTAEVIELPSGIKLNARTADNCLRQRGRRRTGQAGPLVLPN